MSEVACYSTVAMTLGLVVAQPRVAGRGRISPAASASLGVLILLVLGIVRVAGVARALGALVTPFVAIAAIMVMTHVAAQVGVIDWLASRVEHGCTEAKTLFCRVFVLSAICAATLNNDAAVLLLTPLVIRMAQRRFANDAGVVLPLAFAVFLAAGVAPLVVSNPMNLVVTSYLGIGFNEYAARMIPVALVGGLISYFVAARMFRCALSIPLNETVVRPTKPTTSQLAVGFLLLVVLIGYALMGVAGAPLWPIAVAGAGVAIFVGQRSGRVQARTALLRGVSWETLLFLACVLALSVGLRNVGLVDRLIAHYGEVNGFGVGITSAIGSAVLNNHPMANLNMLALDAMPSADTGTVLAALIGGDLGPRLLPIGSLAGLLWLDMLRRSGLRVPTRQFLWVGACVTVPVLVASLWVLSAVC